MLTFLKSERAIAFLKSERSIDGLRWIAAFVAVVLTYGAAAWLVLRPMDPQLDVNAPVVEINLRNLPQSSARPPSDRTSEPVTPANPPGDDAQSALAGAADQALRDAGGAAGRGDAAKDADAVNSKDGSPDAAKTAALDKAENSAIMQPGRPANGTPEGLPLAPPYPPTRAGEGSEAADSGTGGRTTAAPPRVATRDSGTTTAGAPIDTSITVNQGRSLLRTPKAGLQSKGLPLPQLPQLKLTLPLATPNRNELLTRRPSSIVGLALPAPGLTSPASVLTAPTPNQSRAQDLAQKLAIGADGGMTRNAIGVIIERHAAVPPVGTALGVHPLAGAALGGRPPAGAVSSTATHAGREPGLATTALGVPLAAGNASARDTRLPTGAANQSQAGQGHPDRALEANHIASIGGPAVNGAGMNRPAHNTGALGGPAKVGAGGLSGSSFRPKY
jgi:hypothetical protein